MKHPQTTPAAAHRAPPTRPHRGGARHVARDEAAPAGTGDDIVRVTAYAYYEARGRVDGHDLEDWFKAEEACGRLLTTSDRDPTTQDH